MVIVAGRVLKWRTWVIFQLLFSEFDKSPVEQLLMVWSGWTLATFEQLATMSSSFNNREAHEDMVLTPRSSVSPSTFLVSPRAIEFAGFSITPRRYRYVSRFDDHNPLRLVGVVVQRVGLLATGFGGTCHTF